MPYCTDFFWGPHALRITLLQDWTEYPWDFKVGARAKREPRHEVKLLLSALIDVMTGPKGEGFYTLKEAKTSFARSMLLLQREGWMYLSWTGIWRRC